MRYWELLNETRIGNENQYLLSGQPKPVNAFLKRIIDKLIQNPKYRGNIPPEELKTDFDRKDAEKGTLLWFQPTREVQQKLDHIKDWLLDQPVNQNRSLGKANIDLESAYAEANKYFELKNEKASAADDFSRLEVVYKFPDGSFFAKLPDAACLDREGKLMGHCVGSYAREVAEGNKIIYSLRDKNNYPHVTIEAKGNNIHQIKGKGNEAPANKYILPTREFIFKNDFYIIKDWQNINLLKIDNRYYLYEKPESWPTANFDGIEEKYKFSDGWKVVELKTKDSLDIESSFLGNYGIRFKEHEVFSLRDQENRPHAIFKIVNNLIYYLNLNNRLYPNKKYISYIREFLKENVLDIHHEYEHHIHYVTINGKKYEIFEPETWPKKVNHSLVLIHIEYDFKLPDNLKIEGNLELFSSKITTLPDNLHVEGDLDASYTKIKKIPDGLIVDGDLNLSTTKITQLPDNFHTEGSLSLSDTKITKLPYNLNIGENLNIYNTEIRQLPDNLWIGKNLNISRTKISKLPNNLRVGGNLSIYDTDVSYIPDTTWIGSILWIGRKQKVEVSKNAIIELGVNRI